MKEHSATSDHGTGDCPGHRPRVAPDGECVCIRCGTVLSDGYDSQEDGSGIDPSITSQAPKPKSNVNLFLAHKLGGSEVDGLPGLSTARSLEIANRDCAKDGRRRKKGVDAYLSRFSNACSKLGLTHAESEHAWQLFARLYGELSNSDRRIINTSEIACYAIAAGAVATTQQILGERAVARAVMLAFHSKSVRNLYSIRRIIETRSEVVTGIAKPALTASSRWIRGRY